MRERKGMLAAVFGERAGEGAILAVNVVWLEPRKFAAALSGEDAKTDDAVECGRFPGSLPDSYQFRVGQNAIARHLLGLRQAEERIIGNVAALDAPIEEDLGTDEDVAAGAGSLDAIEASRNFMWRNLGELAVELKARKMVPIAVDGARPLGASLILQKQLGRLGVADGVRPGLAERVVRQHPLRFDAGLGEGNDRVAADGDRAPIASVHEDEGLGSALRHAAAGALQRVVPVEPLPILGSWQRAEGRIFQAHLRLILDSTTHAGCGGEPCSRKATKMQSPSAFLGYEGGTVGNHKELAAIRRFSRNVLRLTIDSQTLRCQCRWRDLAIRRVLPDYQYAVAERVPLAWVIGYRGVERSVSDGDT